MPATAEIVPREKKESLATWFSFYLKIEAGALGSNTFKAKRGDLQAFLDYFVEVGGEDHPDRWTKSLTEAFLRHLGKRGGRAGTGLAATTINRILYTLKHASSWIANQRPFLAGNPTERVQDLLLDDPDWRGLTDDQVEALKSALDELIEVSTAKSQRPYRDKALFLILLHTALRASELLGLDYPKNWKGKYFVDVQRKGRKVTRKILLAGPARDALEEYFERERGREIGPLLLSRNGRRLALQDIDYALKRIAKWVSEETPDPDPLHLTAHMLRHTALRKATEKYGIHYAMKMSGHTSDKYIWRYVQPSPSEEEKAMEDLF